MARDVETSRDVGDLQVFLLPPSHLEHGAALPPSHLEHGAALARHGASAAVRHGLYYNWTLPPAISVTSHGVGGELFAGFAPGQAVWPSPAQDGRGRAGVAAVGWRAKDEPACAARFDDRFERLVQIA